MPSLASLLLALSLSFGSTPAGLPFVDVTDALGLDFRHTSPPTPAHRLAEIMGAGVAAFDADGDGLVDLLFAGAPPGGPALFRQAAEGRFVDATRTAGIESHGYGMGVALGDVDNDGDVDVYLTSVDVDRLLRNDGDGTFTDVTAAAGMSSNTWSSSATFCDVDADGLLDLYVGGYVGVGTHDSANSCTTAGGIPDYCPPNVYSAVSDRLYRNLGDGVFADISETSGIRSVSSPALGVVCDDFDGDFRADVFVANDGTANNLWINLGDGTFVDRATLPRRRERVDRHGRAVDVEGERVAIERRFVTDDDGYAALDPLAGEWTLVAREGERRSEMFVGNELALGRTIELELQPVFQARGRVLGASTAALESAWVSVRRARHEDRWDRERSDWRSCAARTGVAPDGTWAMDAVAWAGPGDYIFRLDGGGTVPVERRVPVVDVADPVLIDLEWTAGESVRITVRGPVEEPVPDAEVVLAWQTGAEWVRAVGETGVEGTADFTLPPATFYTRVSAADYAPRTVGPSFPKPGTDMLVPITRAASVEGRVVADGVPVERFRVTFWGGTPTDRQTRSFETDDGRFFLGEVPAETLHVIACSDERPHSEVATFEVEEGELVEVELELPPPISVRGRVVDAANGAPIANATIVVCPYYQHRALEPWGDPVTSSPDGTFELPGISERGLVFASYAGYEKRSQVVPAPAAGESVVDLGLVALYESRPLTVQLVGRSDGDYSALSGRLHTRGVVDQSARDGRLVFDAVSPGHYLFIVQGLNGRLDAEMVLEPSRPWEFELSVGSERELHARVFPPPGGELPSDLWIAATHDDATGLQTKGLMRVDDDGAVDLGFVRGDEVLLQVLVATGEVLARSGST